MNFVEFFCLCFDQTATDVGLLASYLVSKALNVNSLHASSGGLWLAAPEDDLEHVSKA